METDHVEGSDEKPPLLEPRIETIRSLRAHRMELGLS
jgi:hypothetical protein